MQSLYSIFFSFQDLQMKQAIDTATSLGISKLRLLCPLSEMHKPNFSQSFQAVANQCKERRLSLILQFCPTRMEFDRGNPYLQDVLSKGEQSPYLELFFLQKSNGQLGQSLQDDLKNKPHLPFNSESDKGFLATYQALFDIYNQELPFSLCLENISDLKNQKNHLWSLFRRIPSLFLCGFEGRVQRDWPIQGTFHNCKGYKPKKYHQPAFPSQKLFSIQSTHHPFRLDRLLRSLLRGHVVDIQSDLFHKLHPSEQQACFSILQCLKIFPQLFTKHHFLKQSGHLMDTWIKVHEKTWLLVVFRRKTDILPLVLLPPNAPTRWTNVLDGHLVRSKKGYLHLHTHHFHSHTSIFIGM